VSKITEALRTHQSYNSKMASKKQSQKKNEGTAYFSKQGITRCIKHKTSYPATSYYIQSISEALNALTADSEQKVATRSR